MTVRLAVPPLSLTRSSQPAPVSTEYATAVRSGAITGSRALSSFSRVSARGFEPSASTSHTFQNVPSTCV